MKKEKKKTLYFNTSMYNRCFVLNYCIKQLKKDYNDFLLITTNKDAKIILRIDNDILDSHNFIAKACAGWCGLYCGFIINHNYYYYQLDDNSFFEGLFQRIKLDEGFFYVGARYVYTEIDLFKNNESLQSAIKINYFNGFDCWKKYSNKTLLKYARIYYKEYFTKYFLNINDAARVYEKRRVSNYYDNNYHYEKIYDNKEYDIFIKH